MDEAGEVLETLSAALCIFAAGASADTEDDQLRIGKTFYHAIKTRFSTVEDFHPAIEKWLAELCQCSPDDLRNARDK